MDQVALDKAYLRSLVVKLSDTLMMLQRANVAYRDSLRFIRSLPEPDRLEPEQTESAGHIAQDRVSRLTAQPTSSAKHSAARK